MTQLKEAVSLLKKWRKTSNGEWAGPGNDTRSPLETETDDFIEAYRVSLDG